ncbi:transcriptional regulator [Methylobacterium sp. 17Sr1-1]|nr:transcriptional regulator [Methylobacterium sp. 17Sr1-1]
MLRHAQICGGTTGGCAVAGRDEIDARILRVLRDDGRISNADLAAKVGLSPSACLRRLRLLESNGTIRGYTALIEADEREHHMVVLTQITLERQTEESLNRFEAAVRRCPEVRDCYLMTGLSDYLMRIEVSDAGDYERLHKEVLSRLPGVARIQSSFAIRTVVGRG